MGQFASKGTGSQGGRTLRYAQNKGDQLKAAVTPENPLVAGSPDPLGAQEIELAEKTGKVSEASSDDLQKDPVLSGFLDQLGGRVTKRPVQEYEGKMQSDPIKRRQRGQAEAEAEGRLAMHTLKSLLEDSRHPRFTRQGQPDVKLLAESYEVDEKLLSLALKHHALPILEEGEGGKLYGRWPSA